MMNSKKNDVFYVIVLLLASLMFCSGFAPVRYGAIQSATTMSEGAHETALCMVPPEIFDGSGVDPVVVSDVFWSRLAGNFISVMIGNFLAAIVFAFIMSQASAQLSKLGSFITDSIFKGDKGFSGSRASTTSTFRRA